ncbi:hypothetical protein [Metallosphaera javensis (ex Sakai et al. 2022)]|uniref:hypothetical protein n=1 Tax=Metallosphaera javensis (ex Sakai et al. 2022) TaxID=2775498 RepID=UPI0025895CE8|nr:MAG: hypothetical protein MjAS7_1061 [Metallosphaera javensis (ex Sakai et al. 2022)]
MNLAYPIIVLVVALILTVLVIHVELASSVILTGKGGQTYTLNNGYITLYLNMNTTRITPGETIRITALMYYNGNQPIVVNAVDVHVPLPYPCIVPLMIGINIFKGYYTNANISKGTPLQLVKPGIYDCPAVFTDEQYMLIPHSYQLQVICQSNVIEQVGNDFSINVRGYWIPNNSTFPFPSGNFTST